MNPSRALFGIALTLATLLAACDREEPHGQTQHEHHDKDAEPGDAGQLVRGGIDHGKVEGETKD